MSSGSGGPPYEAKIRALGEPVGWRARALETEEKLTAEGRNGVHLRRRAAELEAEIARLKAERDAWEQKHGEAERMTLNAVKRLHDLKAERPGLVREVRDRLVRQACDCGNAGIGWHSADCVWGPESAGAPESVEDLLTTVQRLTGGDE